MSVFLGMWIPVKLEVVASLRRGAVDGAFGADVVLPPLLAMVLLAAGCLRCGAVDGGLDAGGVLPATLFLLAAGVRCGGFSRARLLLLLLALALLVLAAGWVR